MTALAIVITVSHELFTFMAKVFLEIQPAAGEEIMFFLEPLHEGF